MRVSCCVSVLLLIFFSSALFSCKEDAPRIRSAERKIIDSLYKEQAALMKIEMDSLCKESFDRRVKSTMDSILFERKEERKKSLGY